MNAAARKMHQQLSILYDISQQPKFHVYFRAWIRCQRRHDHYVNVHRTMNTTVKIRRYTTIIPITSIRSTSYQQSSHKIASLYYRHTPSGTIFTERTDMMTQRFLSDTSQDDVEEKKEEHKIPEKEPPKLSAEMKKDLAILEKRFIRLEFEPHGRYRGIDVARQMIMEEKLDKVYTKAVANLYLNNWIYRRYALKLGYNKITDVPGEIVANTLIRDGTTIRFWKYKNPKTILKEMYRYPTRPTSMQQRYIEKDYKAESLKNDNGTNTVSVTTPMTPEEEELEKRMWDPTLFRPKLYGYKARREAKERKRQQVQK